MDLILNESRQIYISKINLVQDYIESHLEDKSGWLKHQGSFEIL